MAVLAPCFLLLLLGTASKCDMAPKAYDTIVIGLGSSGMTAATTLARAGKRVLGLEAQNRIGGRVNTVPFGDGVVEVGAEWIHGTKSSRVYELAIANNVSLLSQGLSFDAYRSDGSRPDEALLNELLTFCLGVVESPPDQPEALGHFITRKLTEYLQEKHPDVLQDTDYVEQFLHFMNLVINNYEASNDWNDVSAQTNYEELGGDQHMSWHRHGYKTFFDILMNTYKNGPGLPTLETKLNTEVTQISWPQDPKQNVVVTCKDGTVYTADSVIVTVSLGVLKERHTTLFSAPLPQDKVTAIDKLSFGVVNKIILDFPYKVLAADTVVIWRGEDRKRVSPEDYWTTKLGGPWSTMGATNTLTLWASGDVAKLQRDKLVPCHVWDPINSAKCLFNECIYESYSGHASLFSPKLPQEKISAIATIPMGLMDKIIISFPEAWWPKRVTFFAFLWRGEGRRKAQEEDYWTTRIFGASTPMGSGNTLTLWTSGDAGKLIETLPEDVVKRKCMELLNKFMGANTTIPEPTGIIRSTWYSNPYTRGSYSYDNLLLAQYPLARSQLAAPLVDAGGRPRVLFAGEATDETHFSTVHGASDSGHREAMRLLGASKI